jgi:aspartate aminotransferase/aminotransferase
MNLSVKPALSVAINQMVYEMRAKGTDVISLSLGEAFFRLPLKSFEALDWNRGFHYSDSRGLPELRKVIAKHYGSKYGVLVDPEKELMVTSGSKLAIFMSIKALIKAGETVAIFEPAWVSYREQVILAGGIPVFLSFEKSFEGALILPERTRIVILNNPNNPAGRLYSHSELVRIKRQCDKIGAILLVDEAYSDFVPDSSFLSAMSLGKGVVVVNSLSKNLGMSGWRLGYVIAEAEIINRILILQQNLVTCAPTLLQDYVARYFDEILEITHPQIQELLSKRREVSELLENLSIKFLDGSSTFYFFVDATSLGIHGNVTEYCLGLLLDHGVSVVPGISYGDSTSMFIRIAVGSEPVERIREALYMMISAANTIQAREKLVSKQRALGISNFDWLSW